MKDLLTPRYKVIADYPGNQVEVGTIYEQSDSVYFKEVTDRYAKDAILATEIVKYPHLFSKLYWWDERKVEDMPVHVKTTWQGELTGVHKVLLWKIECLLTPVGYLNFDVVPSVIRLDVHTEPATEQEYHDYIASK